MSIHPLRPHGHGAPAAQPWLCLHASGGAGRPWAHFVAALGRDRAVVAPDLIGYAGAQRWPGGSPASLDDEAKALAPLLNAGPVHLFGHSYGGAVALQIALRWPDRVRSLTLYEPVRFALLLGRPETQAVGESIVGVGRRIGLETLSGAHPAAARRFTDYWAGDGTWDAMRPEAQRTLAARMPKVQAEFEALFADRVPATAYARIEAPVRLLGGTRSPLPARLVLDVLEASLPNVSRVTLAGLGHMGPLEAPARVIPAVDERASAPVAA
jgi:pimeloyl-ACP methyl ester carboxylesterase